MSVNPGKSDGNNPVSRSSQNKSQLLEAMMRNVPKLKELNYTQWKNIITNSIKKAKLWGYVDGSIEEPSEHDATDLTTYYDEATAVRNAILGSLESGAQKYIDEALDPKDAWLALESKYLTAEADADANLVSIEKQLADLRLEEGGDMIEHIAEFCRMRCQLNGTRFALDDPASISILYRSLPSSYRQSVVTPEGTEMKDFGALCARLSYLSQNPEPEAPIDNTPPAPAEDYTSWGVPEDIKVFGLTGDKNPLLEERAAMTCRDCLLKDHEAGTPECPQYEWRRELWGDPTKNENRSGKTSEGGESAADRPTPVNTKRLSYEFSEPVKVILSFDELGLKSQLRQYLNRYSQPTAIQQCAILPIIQGHNVLAQAPPNNGKTTALATSILQIIDTSLPHPQALIFTSTSGATTAFQNVIDNLRNYIPVRCYSCKSSDPLGGPNLDSLAGINNHHIFVGTPDYLLGLIHRNLINKRKLRIMVLDDVDKIIKTGTENQILEVYRHIPPLTQVVASSSIYSSSTAKSIAKLLADPLEIFVGRNEGISIGTHFYVTVSAKQKLDVLYTSFSTLRAVGAVLFCRDIPEFPDPRSTRYGYYYLRDSMEPHERRNVIQGFTSAATSLRSRSTYSYDTSTPVSKVGLVIPDTALSTAGLSNIGIPLINYDVPNNVEDYVKRLEQWRVADPGQSQMIITFVTADTDEINVLRDLERRYGVHVAELLWEGGRLQ
ncbi:unnamed protein product [Rhizoctonia solani]|uniref:RNA helicase n=1 Tax=Rhizoctonia solani TaxID=456999 RepID=A0A8H3DB79_9AGAM|nr:unnamed protein product [Rhizoctonia solani]